MKLDYEQDVKIDQDALDVEWLEQADLARRYAKHVKARRREVARLEEKKKTIRAELIDYVNRNPDEATGKSKPNSADIESYYRRQQRYKDAVEELLDAQEDLDYAELAHQEISWTRKKALEQLVTMWLGEYFAGPKVPRNLAEELRKKKEERRERSKKVLEQMKRRKKDDTQE